MPTTTFQSMEHLAAHEAEQARDKTVWELHGTHPQPAHGTRRALERAIIRGRHRRGRYGLKAMLVQDKTMPDGLACFVGEEVPMTFTADGFGYLACVELDICQIHENYPLHQILWNARRKESDQNPYAEHQDQVLGDKARIIGDEAHENLDEAMSITGARMQFFTGMGPRDAEGVSRGYGRAADGGYVAVHNVPHPGGG